MKKRYDEYNVGELLLEFDARPVGTIISMMEDPYRATRAYLLVRSADGSFTILVCLKDALCEPHVAKNIPEQVMRNFLWDAFVGMELHHSNEEPGNRVPMLDPLPKYEVPEKKELIKVEDNRPKPVLTPVPPGEETAFPQGGTPVPESQVEIPPEEEKKMLPEFDFFF